MINDKKEILKRIVTPITLTAIVISTTAVITLNADAIHTQSAIPVVSKKANENTEYKPELQDSLNIPEINNIIENINNTENSNQSPLKNDLTASSTNNTPLSLNDESTSHNDNNPKPTITNETENTPGLEHTEDSSDSLEIPLINFDDERFSNSVIEIDNPGRNSGIAGAAEWRGAKMLPIQKYGEYYYQVNLTSEEESQLRDNIIKTAASRKGLPYVWGGTDPNKGMDCSGYSQWVYKMNGIDIPRVVRTQRPVFRPITESEVKKGDLVFMYGTKHVGIVLDPEKKTMWHAPRTGKDIEISTWSWYSGISFGTIIHNVKDPLPNIDSTLKNIKLKKSYIDTIKDYTSRKPIVSKPTVTPTETSEEPTETPTQNINKDKEPVIVEPSVPNETTASDDKTVTPTIVPTDKPSNDASTAPNENETINPTTEPTNEPSESISPTIKDSVKPSLPEETPNATLLDEESSEPKEDSLDSKEAEKDGLNKNPER